MPSRKLVAAALILTAAGLTSAPSTRPGEPLPATSSTSVADRIASLEDRLAAERRDDAIRRGAVIHGRACAACHARDGGGDGPGALELDTPPRDFKAAKYRIRSTLSGEPPRRVDVEHSVRRGLPGTAMPAFDGVLSEGQIADVVTFIMSLGPRRLDTGEPEALTIPEFPVPTASSRSGGRAVYLVLGCWKCHGLDGSGRGPSAAGLKSDEGHPIQPRDFRYEPFKGGRSPETVARAALSGLIGTPMPSHAEVMVVPREAIDLYAESLPARVRPELDEFRLRAPASTDLVDLEEDAWQALRDGNLIALAHYVLSLDLRGRLGYKLFGQEPEREARKTIRRTE